MKQNKHLKTEQMKLKNIRLAGKVFEIECFKDSFQVKSNGKNITGKYGKPVVLK